MLGQLAGTAERAKVEIWIMLCYFSLKIYLVPCTLGVPMITQKFTPFLTIKHHVDGEISFSVDDERVKIRCRWPFDLYTNEWIYVANDFDKQRYIDAVSDLAHRSYVKIHGIKYGELRIRTTDEGLLKLSIVDCTQIAPTEFNTTVDILPADLIPSQLAYAA